MSNQNNAASVLSEGNNALCIKIYRYLMEVRKGSFFYSPTSLEFSLALLYAGAEGSTAKELQSILNLPKSKDKTYAAVSVSMNTLTGLKNVTLNIANGLFIQENFKLCKTFMDVSKKYFASEVTNVDFVKPEAADTINDFVAKKTNNKISKVYSSDSFDSFTRLVIGNAIYFKGNWANPFDRQSTFRGDFHLSKNEKVQVDFMKQLGTFPVGYNDDLKANILVLPYEGNEISMVLVIPDEIEGLKEVEDKILNMNLMDLTENVAPLSVTLHMPKFQLESTVDVKEILCEMGMTEMFSDRANLSGIADKPLFVSEITHKSLIEVNEEGAEAAAFTGITVSLRMMPMSELEINVNSPFLFFIYCSSNTILFIGRVCHP